jgi:hypothetical protein
MVQELNLNIYQNLLQLSVPINSMEYRILEAQPELSWGKND